MNVQQNENEWPSERGREQEEKQFVTKSLSCPATITHSQRHGLVDIFHSKLATNKFVDRRMIIFGIFPSNLA